MKVLITGGSGYIGSALAEDLAKDGHEAIVLSRNPERVVNLPHGVRLEKWDGRTAQGWGDLVDGADAIVNLAGENLSADRWTKRRKQQILESRLNAGNAVLQAVQQSAKKPLALIQSSAVGYYGPSGDEWLTEAAPPAADFLGRQRIGKRRCSGGLLFWPRQHGP